RLSPRPVPLSPYRRTTSVGRPPCPTVATSQERGDRKGPTPASFLPPACGTTIEIPQSPGRTALKIGRIPFARWEKRPPTLHRPSLPEQGTQSQGRGRHVATAGTRAPVSGKRC
ncbi:unnamed protein product, partial [Bubo scandiacus]